MSWHKKRTIIIYLVLIPLLIFTSYYTWLAQRFNLLALLVIALASWPFLSRFEKKNQTSRELVLLASFVTLGIVSRFLFFFLPGVSPVAALVIISGMFFGSELGFMTGLLTPLLSNVFFTQGPWTPFQMFAYGFIGFVAGMPLIGKQLKKNKFALGIYGLLAGISYSLMMDVWTVLSIDQSFSWQRYLLVLVPAIPYTITYVVGNIAFLLSIVPLMSPRLEKLKIDFQLRA